MGSQSSSGMSGGGGSSSGTPAERSEAAEPNQSSSRGRRADRQPSADEDVDLAEVLAYLLRRSLCLGQDRALLSAGAVFDMRGDVVLISPYSLCVLG